MDSRMCHHSGMRHHSTMLSLALAATLLAACSDRRDNPIDPPAQDHGTYALIARYDTIRSYPGGGGLFLLAFQPDSAFGGTVRLHIECDPLLQPQLSSSALSRTDSVLEILLAPGASILPDRYPVTVVAAHNGVERRLSLAVTVFDWQQGAYDDAMAKRDLFRDWLVSRNPGYAEIFEAPLRIFGTYPQILIVEHYTSISPRYECRFCFHVMIPPYDWSLMRVRSRFSLQPEIALKREPDGTIHTIPLSDYPVLLGY
jgi:hypothetical protein